MKRGFHRWSQSLNQCRQPPASRFRFILDRRDVLGAIFVSPAILYVLLLVGVPFLMAVYYSVSAYTIYNPSWQFVGLANFVADRRKTRHFRRTLGNTFIFTFGSQILGLVLGKFGALVLLRPFPGRKIVRALIILPWAVPIALATVAWEWMFDSLYSVINWTMIALGVIDPRGRAELARQPGSGDALRDRRQCLAVLSVRDRHLPRRHHRRAAGRARRGDGRRRRLLAPQLPDHRADDPADRGHRPDFRHRVYVHRPFHRLSADQWAVRSTRPRCWASRASRSASLSGDVSHGAAISLFMLPVLFIVVILMLRFIRRREI